MAEPTERWIDSGSGPGRTVPARVQTAVGRVNERYRDFLHHVQTCAACQGPDGDCDVSQELRAAWLEERGKSA
ncbi:hypothetical protein ABZ883_03285 [Streptomyces sp. NPDC046977]|uniref:hypothetical protein n=1 Tax=Streptomyces sp. NPDC046977 TaxID=3154703 RepID=UPI00340471DC